MRFSIIKITLYLISLYWTVWLVFTSYKTPCFNLFDSYVTVITIMSSMIINDLIN